jgi:hypothetical protein
MKLGERFGQMMQIMAVGLLCMPVIGYFLFSIYMPIVVWPYNGVPNVLLLVAVCSAMGLAAGLLLDSMESMVYAAFAAMIFGEAFAVALNYSPIASGQIEAVVGAEIAADVFRVSLPAALACLLIFIIAGFAGQALQESWMYPEGDEQ